MLAGVLLAGCGEPQPPPQRPAPAAGASRGEDAVGKPRLGLWIPCEGSERALDDPERVRRLLDGATELGVSDLFVQVYRGGRSWYAAQLADDSPHRALDGADPLGDLVRGAHARGLRVHAWVNVLTLGTHRDGPLLRAVGRDAVQVDRRGRSLLDYPDLQVPADEQRFARVGTPGVWLDPATPALAERLGAVFAELLVRVPDLDGLHLDYVRYPDVLPFVPGARFDVGLDFGFGAPSRTRFRAETGLDAPFADDSRNAEAFDAWRREKLGDVVGEISRAARRARPGLVVSAAVWAFPTRAYLSLHQDWTHWLESGHLDFAVAMAYSRDPRLFTMMARSNVAIGGSRTWLGLGAWLFESAPERAVAQLREARALAPGGVVLFSWDALVASPELRGALAAERVP